MDWLNQWLPFQGQALWLTDVVALIFAGAVVDFLQRRLLSGLVVKTRRTENFWDDALIDALRAPLSLLVWVVVTTLALQIADQGVGQGFARFVPEVRELGVLVAVTWFLIRWISNVHASLLERPRLAGRDLDKTTIDALRRLANLVIAVVAAVTVLQTMGFDLSAVLAVGGIGGVAVGFASRDVVANFFGGLMIFVMKPFNEGDWIRSPDREIEGTVEQIGWYSTIIRTFESRPLYVPNAIFTGISLENPSRMKNRRINETIGLRYDDFAQVEPIVAAVEKMLREHPEIEAERQTLMVNFNRFAPSALDFFIYVFTKTTSWTKYHVVKQDVLRRIGEIVAEHGAEVAFPTQTILLPEPLANAGVETGGKER